MRPEVARRLVHASGTGVPLLYLLDLATWRQVRLLLLVGSLCALALEAVRLLVGLDWVVFDRLTREYEADNLAGYALYAFGATVAALAFSPSIAIPAILMLTIGDPVSGLLGSGELRRVKQFRVLATMFVVCLALTAYFVVTPKFDLPPRAAVAAALAATLADGVKPVVRTYVVDDNLTIPIAAGVAAHVTIVYLPAA